jgi:hypothetical protein
MGTAGATHKVIAHATRIPALARLHPGYVRAR